MISPRFHSHAVVACLVVTVGVSVVMAQSSTPAEAIKAVGETRTVEFVVKSTGFHKRTERYHLDSDPNFTWDSNLAIVIDKKDAGRFPTGGAGVEKFYKGKKLKVTGTIEKFDDMTGIRITRPQQLTVTDANPARDPLENPPTPDLMPDDFDPSPPNYWPFVFVGIGVLVFGSWMLIRFIKKRKAEQE